MSFFERFKRANSLEPLAHEAVALSRALSSLTGRQVQERLDEIVRRLIDVAGNGQLAANQVSTFMAPVDEVDPIERLALCVMLENTIEELGGRAPRWAGLQTALAQRIVTLGLEQARGANGRGNWREAEELSEWVLSAVVYLPRKVPAVYRELGLTLAMQGRYSEARQTFARGEREANELIGELGSRIEGETKDELTAVAADCAGQSSALAPFVVWESSYNARLNIARGRLIDLIEQAKSRAWPGAGVEPDAEGRITITIGVFTARNLVAAAREILTEDLAHRVEASQRDARTLIGLWALMGNAPWDHTDMYLDLVVATVEEQLGCPSNKMRRLQAATGYAAYQLYAQAFLNDGRDEEARFALKRAATFQRLAHVRVFVSSTFHDMQAEREELIKRVFPQLRKICTERGVGWTEVDLRWGIPDDLEAEGQVLPICLEEIENCRPYFIGLLGERYGSVPRQIEMSLREKEPWLEQNAGRSYTELEILHGVLNSPSMAEHALFYFRSPSYLETIPPDRRALFDEVATPEDIKALGRPEATRRTDEQRRKLRELKDRIRQSGLSVREGYPDPQTLGEWVLRDLRAKIDDLHPEAISEPMSRELRDQETFFQMHAWPYVGGGAYVSQLEDHLQSDGLPLVLWGRPGCGKSAFVAAWQLSYRAGLAPFPLVAYAVDATARSADWKVMLRSLLTLLHQETDVELEIPDEPASLRAALAIALERIAERGRVVIVIDGLDHLDDREGALDLAWLPSEIPSNVRLVLTTGVVSERPIEELMRRGWALLDVGSPLTPDERAQLADLYLARWTKTLTPGQVDRICSVMWLQELDSSRPLVFVYLGTGGISAESQMSLIAGAFASSEVTVVAAVGATTESMVVARAPGVRFEKLVPARQLLRRASLLIFHGGRNLAMNALACGVPSLAFPGQDAERDFYARRLELLGICRRCDDGELAPATLAELAESMMHEVYRVRAAEVASSLPDLRGAEEVIEILNALVEERPS